MTTLETEAVTPMFSATRVVLTFQIDQEARLGVLAAEGGRGYSQPTRADRVARRTDGAGGTEASIGIARVDHTTVVATTERVNETEAWGWPECRLAVDTILADLSYGGLVERVDGRPYVGGNHLRLLSAAYEFQAPSERVDAAAFCREPDAAMSLVPDLLGAATLGRVETWTEKPGATLARYEVLVSPDAPMNAWTAARATTDLVHEHLHAIGLHYDISDLRQWVRSRDQATRDAGQRLEPHAMELDF